MPGAGLEHVRVEAARDAHGVLVEPFLARMVNPDTHRVMAEGATNASDP